MNILEKISLLQPETEFLKADGLDEAVIGFDDKSERLIYSVRKVLMILMKRDGMDPEEAQEFFDFNIGDAYINEKTPIWCQDCF